MSLQIEIKSKRNKYYETSVILKLREFENSNRSLCSFPETFKDSLKVIPRKSVGRAEDFYRAVLSEDQKKVEIWHLTVKGDTDRLLAVVTDNGKQFNPFNF
ncbi:hypothetical protein CFS9_13350 [Flavobacterium sp. CFS9]|uniref:GLPGLI family protein n=1 Tax=Flavobacterium sp. CFS9 TaxID=3143118 RepID=A0AAT9GZS5_9FLAO